MTIDIIILSYAKTQQLLELTQRTIDSCHASETDIKFNILVIEQVKGVMYANCKTMHVTGGFNYNAFLNIGLTYTTNQYAVLCNNDLVFGKGWAGELIGAMMFNDLLSASPYCPITHGKNSHYSQGDAVNFGNLLHHHVAGFCIAINRDILKKIGKLNEDYPFWFADNAYCEQLKAHGIKHARIKASEVTHLGSNTLNTMDNKDALTHSWIKKFCKEYPDNESAKHFSKVR